MLREKEIKGLSGWPMLFAMLALAVFASVSLIGGVRDQGGWIALTGWRA